MAENKTQASEARPEDYLAAIADELRRQDGAALVALMAKATKQPPVMWGAAMIARAFKANQE